MTRSARRRRRHQRYGLLATALAAGALAAPAPAQQLPEDNSGTGQYVEPVPDAGGDRPAAPGAGGSGGGGGQGGSGGQGGLPASVRGSLPPGGEGRALERLATDPGSGAPSDGGRGGSGGGKRGGSGGGAPGDADASAIAALASAAVGGDGPAIPLILFGALALTLGAAGLRVRGRRS